MAGKKAKAKARKAAETAAANTGENTISHSDYLEIRPAGKKGYGAFATKFIPANTIIHKEKAIMTIHKTDGLITPWDVDAAYRKLSTSDKQIFDKMRKCECDLFYCKGKFQIFEGNKFNVAEDWSIVGAYPTASRLNHSCAANCIAQSKDCKGAQRVSDTHDIVTIKDVQEGEELTFAYIQEVQYMTTKERQAFFEEKDQGMVLSKGWTCQCELCSLPSKDRLASDLRRCIMRHLHYWIRQKGQDLPTVESVIKTPIRKLNSFQVAMFQLLWAYLAEAEGLTFTTYRWRWWGYVSGVLHIMLRAWDKKLTCLPVKTVDNVREWWANANDATDQSKALEMANDLKLHAAAACFTVCVQDDGLIWWDELEDFGMDVIKAHAGTTLDY